MADWSYPGLKPDHDRNPCDGCHECGLRCTAGVQMTRAEFKHIVEHLRASDPEQVERVLHQDKAVIWFEDIRSESCLFYDMTRRGCLIYPVRPLICRLFGRVEWLPCPIGRPLKKLHGGLELIQSYARERRATFPQWCEEVGIFDLKQLTSRSQ